MSSMGKRHEATDENGIGLCSVPMWCGGGPAGFGDTPEEARAALVIEKKKQVNNAS